MNKFLNLVLLILFVLILPQTEILCESQKPPVNWQLDIKWENVPLTEIPITDTSIRFIDGHADVFLTVDNSELSKGVAYKAEGTVNNATIYLPKWEEEINKINGSFAIENRELTVTSMEGQFKSIPFNAEGNLKLTTPHSFTAKVKAKDVILEELTSFFPFLKNYSTIKTPADAEFNISGVFPSGPVEGTISFQEALAYSILMNNVEISFVWDGNKAVIRNFSANLSEGKISGEGEIHLK